LDEPRLDQLFAEPIVKQLMRSDRIDEATTRRLLRQAAIARAPPSALRAEGLQALSMWSPTTSWRRMTRALSWLRMNAGSRR
jgi:hypothetical protein